MVVIGENISSDPVVSEEEEDYKPLYGSFQSSSSIRGITSTIWIKTRNLKLIF